MSLKDEKILIIDCQTTGMHPSLGQVLEIAWAVGDPMTEMRIESYLVQLEDGEKIPARVKEITGIKDSDMIHALPKETIREKFIQQINDIKTAVIHYAQFEKAFLIQFLNGSETEKILPFDVVCTHLISKRLFPDVPSRNIRALSGFLGSHQSQVKRAGEHVAATIEIWNALIPVLEEQGLQSMQQVQEWLSSAPKKKSTKYEYRVDKEKRLSLPEKPGVYRMLSKNGGILYVGKATCLRDRVNSYFRGKKNRDPRKLEMISQAWDLQVTECDSALEAALLETDEIKKHNPPYNVSLKSAGRKPIYYSRDFREFSTEKNDGFKRGPFRRMNSVEELKAVVDWIKGGSHFPVFYNLFTLEQLILGYDEFQKRHSETGNTYRSHLVLAFRLFRAEIKASSDSKDEIIEETEKIADAAVSEEELNTSPEEVANKFERIYIRAAATIQRSKKIKALSNSKIRWQENEIWREIEVENGRLKNRLHPSVDIQEDDILIADYDRMSVLLSEVEARNHEIEYR